ncbi:unnamed protein product (macronuclear) [Paramecium tetraurelia]|uniref:asparaginase n=1 Tax=Paramecium tetraurelia TaxID=5888 RepID=A0DE25_PARTE|nr:uncharacterized protein GSPATT00016134001 [Paramecium tetraurelia]CAK81292.1 unnamed protein product [Paramecium tetraurelia]|eukprot:XP_001448689.1 hypothetical protein (macronuclear) [Paramecium tetraurelia strain d4-2]
MSSGGETPKLKSQGSRHDTTNSSLANIGGAQQNLQVLNDRKVLMIYASGATAAEGEVSESHMTVLKGRLEQRLKNISFLCDLEYTQYHNQEGCLTTPISEFGRRTVYKVMELEQITNSRQTSYVDIRHIAEIIKENYEKYSAFVILSGIATITYLGTNLSFMLENLQKTVVITGSLIPLSFMRNDAFQNILDSLILAGHFLIPEVVIVMDHKAYRANRCRQLKCDSLDCIESPNFPPLVEFGINIEIKWQLVLRRGEQMFTNDESTLELAPPFVTDIIIIKITPYTSVEHIRHILNTPKLRCCILECYHFGEMPHNQELYNVLLYAQQQLGIILIQISQCTKGQPIINFKKVVNGIIVQYDITPESAQAKIAYLLGKGYSQQEILRKFPQNLQGETESVRQFEKFEGQKQHFIQTILETLQKTSGDEQISQNMDIMNKYIIPNLGCFLATTGQLELIKDLRRNEGNLNIPDFDGRTVLHLAAANKQIEIIKYLIEEVHAEINPIDYLGYSPMYEVLISRDKELLLFFQQNGGIISAPHHVMVDLILSSGLNGDLQMLELIFHGGIKNLNEFVNVDNRNIAHMAVMSMNSKIIKFLRFKAKFDFSERDRWGSTPYENAIEIKSKKIKLQMLNEVSINEIIEMLATIGNE